MMTEVSEGDGVDTIGDHATRLGSDQHSLIRRYLVGSNGGAVHETVVLLRAETTLMPLN